MLSGALGALEVAMLRMNGDVKFNRASNTQYIVQTAFASCYTL